MATFITVIFWIIVFISILFIYLEIDSPFSDGFGFVIVIAMWIFYGIMYVGLPVKAEYERVNNFEYKKTEAGMHVFYGNKNLYTNDIYLIKNIEDTTKVEVALRKEINSNENYIDEDLVIRKFEK